MGTGESGYEMESGPARGGSPPLRRGARSPGWLWRAPKRRKEEKKRRREKEKKRKI